MGSGLKPALSPTSLKESEAIKTCDNRTPHAENSSFVYCFLNPIFFKYSHCNGNKIHYLKTIDYDKQPLALAVYSIDLELEGFETPEESRFIEQY